MDTAEPRLARAPAVLSRRVGDGLLLTTAETDSTEHLSPSGAAVWAALERPQTVAQVTAAIARRFRVDPEVARSDIEALLVELRRLRLIIEASDA